MGHQKFSPKDHGRPDPRTWRRASRAAAARFGSWKHGQIASNYAKSRNCCNKRTRFSFFFDLFSVFRFFFRLFFAFLCSILVGSRLPITNLTKSKNCKKNYFFSFLFPFFLVVFQCFSNYFLTEKTLTFSIYLQIICSNPKKQFSIYIFELFSKLRKTCELFPILKHMLILFMPLPVRLPQ